MGDSKVQPMAHLGLMLEECKCMDASADFSGQ